MTLSRLKVYAVAAVVLTALYWGARYRIAEIARGRAEGVAMEAAARLAHGIVGKRTSERQIEKSLLPDNKEYVKTIRKTISRARVDSAFTATVGISDTAKTVETKTPEGTTVLCDEYRRFCFELPAGILTRRQLFKMETVFVRSPDGKTRVAHADFFEYNPDTKEVIPTVGVDLKGAYSFVDEKAAAPPIFHPRLLIGVDSHLAPGVGVELLNLERTEKPVLEKVTLSLVGYWDRKTQDGYGVAQFGYRILNSNITIGPYVGASTKGALVVGAGAAIQVTR